MSIAEKVQAISQNMTSVYGVGYINGQSAGYTLGYEDGKKSVDFTSAFTEGYNRGKQEEYDRFWDNFQAMGTRKCYRYAFAGAAWTEETLKPKYPIKIIDDSTTKRFATHMFAYLGWWNNYTAGGSDIDMTEICKSIDFSEAVSLTSLFDNAVAKNITINASNAVSLSRTFALGDGGRLNNITLTVSNVCTNFDRTFLSCSTLTDLTITDGSQIVASIDLHWSPLTKASIESVISALSNTATGQTVSFKKTAVESAFTTDQWNALIAPISNWSFTLA